MELHIFDLDETLIAGDSGVLWHQFLVKEGVVTQAGFLEQDAAMMQQYALGELALEQYIAFSLKPIKHLNSEQVDRLVSHFVQQQVNSIVYPQGQTLISQLKQNHEVLIISATVSFIVNQVAQLLGVKHYLGVDLHADQGKYTEQIQGVASFREGKVTRLKQWLSDQSKQYSSISFYSDSINDQPLLEYVDNAYTVNPCPRLKQLASERNWTQFSWQL
ncbi:HAD family hydrolase [Agarivorans aestuarii]|uniref:HAD family hydrolase n=1 Tax=Agarivorans aestuarii TaxID=1563703 RepID=A0ABU7G4J4_9ALTE|nr:HAD family hydrolase [Agarivorans aestuarii]MEE1674236.1 HAD family hydrolase [Agarivorans aestuarii]